MKAVKLQQVIQFFNPTESLRGQLLHNWFVPRPQSSRQALQVILESERRPVKLLFVGHRGSGKRTELNKLSEELTDAFVTVPFDVLEITGRTTPTYEDLMLTMSSNVTRYCIEQGLVGQPLAEPLRAGWQAVSRWWRTVVTGSPIRSSSEEIATYATLGTLLGEIEVGARQSSQTRDQIRDQINRQMPQLLDHFNWVLREVHATLTPKRLLVLVEGLDKIDLQAARDIFRDHAPTITAPQCAMIYTFPLALRHSDDYDTVSRAFDDARYLTNWTTRRVDGAAEELGVATLRNLVLARLKSTLIEEAALDLAIGSCGGIPVQLVRLVRSAAVLALVRSAKAKEITLPDMQEAVKDLRRELSAPLSSSDWRKLHVCHTTRQLNNDPDMQRLLYNGALIDYSNGDPWCDVHPALWALLERYNREQP
jgi:hypothetical protein